MYYTYIVCITIDSVIRMEKKNYLQVYLEENKHRIKKSWSNSEKLESESEPELESDIESELKSDTE